MSTIETATGCRITVGPKGLALWDRSAHLIGYELSTPLTADERRALSNALRGREPGDEYVDWKGMYDQARRERDAAVYAYDKAERERDEWKASAEALEAEAEESFEQGATWQKTRTAPTVTRADIEKAICSCPSFKAWNGRVEAIDAIDAVWGMLTTIEAAQAEDPEPDPVEVAIRSGLTVWGTTDRAVQEIAASVRRVLGQEADQ